ncbi:MAG: T9SS type A sorting domain-containing protein [Chitinophagaceae bacterium]|nr:MAG: T9SS type A sorting domain-containing protein [Chitinophagaceae bacterium]
MPNFHASVFRYICCRFMKKTLLLSFYILLVCFSKTFAQGNSNTLDVVSWNVEWFGSPSNSPADDDLQEQNVKTVLRFLNADIYGLVEVVDSARLRRLVDSLGSQFAYVLSPFCSGNSTGTGNAWLTGQKLAFVYNKNLFTNVSARGMMRNSGPAYTAFASGRFPYILTADVTVNNVTKRMNFILIHGKAGSTVSDYQRRKDAAQELKDTLDTYYSTTTNIIIGDYNDALYGTICSGCGTLISSYDPIVKDSTDADHYKSVTLPLAVDGQTSMVNFPNVVDNHVISNEAEGLYVPNSARIFIDVTNLVANYGNTTTDHYPVLSQYNLSGVITGITTVDANILQITATPNPFRDQLTITAGKLLKNVRFQLFDSYGRLIIEEEKKLLAAHSSFTWTLNKLAAGIYYLRLTSDTYQSNFKLLHTR